MNDAEALVRFRKQHGIITREQARNAGLSDRQISRRVKSAAWERVDVGLFRHPAIDPTWHGDLLAACYRLGAIASHRSAAHLHGISGYGPSRPEVVVPRGRRGRYRNTVVHESTQFDLVDHTVLDQVPCTGAARTVLDLAAVVSRAQLKATVRSATDTGLVDWADLYQVLVNHSRRGRDGCRALRDVLEVECGEPGVAHECWVAMVADWLTEEFQRPPTSKHRVFTASGAFVGLIDLAYPDRQTAVRLGRVDRRGDERLTRAGWTVLNITWSDYIHARVGFER